MIENRSFKLRTSIILLSSVVALSACSTITPATQIETSASASQSLPPVPISWDSARESVGDVQVGWIADYNDPLLLSLVQEAQENNRNLRAAAANVKRAWALAKQAGSPLLPSVDAVGGFQRNQPFETSGFSNFSIGIQASYEIDIWNRIEAGQQAAVESARAAEANFIFSQYSIASAVAQSYFLVIESDQQIKIAQDISDALTEITRIVELRYRYGFASAYDVSLAQADLASSIDTLITARNGKKEALRALEALLGRYPGADLDTPRLLPSVPSQPPSGVPSDLLNRRPDIIAAERSIASAINSRKVSEAALLPSISLTGTLGGASNELDNLLDPANVALTLASNILAPIFDGGARRAQIEVSKADVESAVEIYADTAINAFFEVEAALDRGIALRRSRDVLERADRETANAVRLSLLQYQEGEIDLIDVLSIQQRRFGTRSSLLSVKRAQLDQYLEVSLALGGNWQEVKIANEEK